MEGYFPMQLSQLL